MPKAHISGIDVAKHIHAAPAASAQTSELDRIAASTAVLIVGAGAIAVLVPVITLSVILYVLGL